MNGITEYNITGMGKPRMLRHRRRNAPPAVERYWQFKELCQLKRVSVPESGYHLIFVLPMPKRWSEKKKAEMNGTRHQQKPDKDNLEKALLDAIYDDDSKVWDGRVSKVWGYEGKIIVKQIPEPKPCTIRNLI